MGVHEGIRGRNVAFALVVLLVTLLSFLLRMKGLDHGAPTTVHHPDVVKQTVIANAVLHGHKYIHQDLEKQYGSRAFEWTMYPYGTATLVGRLMRLTDLETGRVMTRYEKWSWAYRLRILASLFWVGAVLTLTVWAATRFGILEAGVLGLLLAAEPFNNQYSHYAMNTVPMVAMTLVAWLCCLGMRKPGWRGLLCAGLAGLTIALGAGIKYQAVFAGIFALIAWAYTWLERGGKQAGLAAVCGGLGGYIGLKLTAWIPMYHPVYFAENIGAFMAWQKTVLGTGIEFGDQVRHNLAWLWRFGVSTGAVLLVPGVCWGLSLIRHGRGLVLHQALAFGAALYVVLMLGTLVIARELMRSNDMLVVLPFMALLCVLACHTAVQSPRHRIAGRLGGVVMLCLGGWYMNVALKDSFALDRLDTRDVAAQWCRDHLQPGESVMRERYVNGIGLEGLKESKTRYLCDKRVRGRIESGEFTYLVTSSLAYGRFFDPLDPRYQPKNIRFYNSLTNDYQVMHVIDDRELEFSHPVITVYRKRTPESGDE